MKWLLVFLISILNTCYFYAQDDFQWIIRNQKGKNGYVDGLNQYGHNLNTQKIKVINITEPSTILPNLKVPNNDFFFIYTTGDYDNFKVLNGYNNTDCTIRSNGIPMFGYLTNTYETDDAPQDVEVNTTTDTSVYGNQRNKIILDVNHDIVDGKDITIIVNESLASGNCSGHMKLCYNLPPNCEEYLKFNPSFFDPVDANTSNSLMSNNTGVFGYGGQKEFFDEQCFDFVLNGNNAFFNFKTEIVNRKIVNKDVSFYLKCEESNDIIASIDVLVNSKFHDPNYVQVMCVWKDKKSNKVKYKVSCYNDEVDSVGDISLCVGLPDAVDVNSIEILDWCFSCKNGCSENKILKKQLIQGNELVVEYEDSWELSGLEPNTEPTCAQTTWFTFCADLNLDLDNDGNEEYDLETVPLFVENPFTTFNGQVYPITTFIDPMKCTKRPNQNSGCLEYERNPKKCKCSCNKRGFFNRILGWGHNKTCKKVFPEY